MLSAYMHGMHRHTRPSAYADKKQQRRSAQSTSRPGAYGFSFSGEFPEAPSAMPVEAAGRRRHYTAPSGQTGSYQAVGSQGTMRLPAINRYGVRLGPAIVLFVFFAALLAGLVVWQYAGNTRLSKLISEQEQRMVNLGAEADQTLSEISVQSSGVNIRQEATRIGLKSSRGVTVEYLNVPKDAVFGPGAGGVQDMASVLGQ